MIVVIFYVEILEVSIRSISPIGINNPFVQSRIIHCVIFQPFYQFVKEFTRLRDNRQGLSLIDKEGTTECIMLDGADCRLQSVKPFQCTGFPNRWNFENWREACEAIPVPRPEIS